MSNFIKRCPCCLSDNVGWKNQKVGGFNGKSVWCKDCGLKLVNESADYLYWRWNRPKETQAEYIIPLISKAPDNLAYCNKELVKIWGGEEALCKFLKEESGHDVICMPCLYNPEGVLLKGI